MSSAMRRTSLPATSSTAAPAKPQSFSAFATARPILRKLVRAIYVELDARLVGAAALSVLAHLEDLAARGLVATDGAPSIAGRYRLPG